MNKLNIKFLLLVSIFFNVYQLQADERNTDLNQTTPEDIEARVRRRAQDLNRGRVGYEDTGAPGWDNPEPMPNYGIFFLCPAGACGGMRKIFPSAKVAHSEPSGASVMKFAAELQHLTHHSGVPSSRTAATLPERSAR